MIDLAIKILAALNSMIKGQNRLIIGGLILGVLLTLGIMKMWSIGGSVITHDKLFHTEDSITDRNTEDILRLHKDDSANFKFLQSEIDTLNKHKH